VFIIFSALLNKYVDPYHRVIPTTVITVANESISVLDPAINLPMKPDTVPSWAAGLLGIATPPFIAAFAQIIYRSAHDLHDATLGTVVAWTATEFFTICFKLYAGRPRPYWGQDHTDPKESILSFPSGHTSTVFVGMVFLTLYGLGKFKLYQKSRGRPIWKFWTKFYVPVYALLLLPFFVGLIVAVSRTRDYHHNFDDVTAGALIGSVMGISTYFIFYPSLFNRKSHKPRNRNKIEENTKYTRSLEENSHDIEAGGTQMEQTKV